MWYWRCDGRCPVAETVSRLEQGWVGHGLNAELSSRHLLTVIMQSTSWEGYSVWLCRDHKRTDVRSWSRPDTSGVSTLLVRPGTLEVVGWMRRDDHSVDDIADIRRQLQKPAFLMSCHEAWAAGAGFAGRCMARRRKGSPIRVGVHGVFGPRNLCFKEPETCFEAMTETWTRNVRNLLRSSSSRQKSKESKHAEVLASSSRHI